MNLLESKEFKDIVELANKDKNVLALVLFGSYSRGDFKESSDLDLCIFKVKRDILPHEFEILKYQDKKNFDILFYDNLPDIIKFRVFSEGKVLVLNNSKDFFNLRRSFLHKYRDEYPFYERQLNKLLARI